MQKHIETLIIGGGQAGLSVSYYLTQSRREHIVLEGSDRAGNAWRNDRWDSFTLVTPNWAFRLPGAEYDGQHSHSFMPRNEIVSRFESYVERFHLPVHYGVKVLSVESEDSGYRVECDQEAWNTAKVVMATGLYQEPKIPPFHDKVPGDVLQLPSGKYRNPSALPSGAVLVVGSGQSGCQIAEELYQAGREVHLCTGKAGRAPRRYRGKDAFEWLDLSGFLDRPADQLPSPAARFAGNPHLSGKDGGHSTNLHQFYRDGVTLLGHLRDIQGGKFYLEPDLKAGLQAADKFEADLTAMIDGYIEKTGLEAPHETLPRLQDGYAAPEITELDMKSAGITSVIWALGYTFDFNLVHLPILDRFGYPTGQRGLTDYKGLYFVGLPWLAGRKSGLLLGVGEHAAEVAAHIAQEKVAR
jgi:putative flavoprotein involved in K+ transport